MPNAMAISLQPAQTIIQAYYTIAGPWNCFDQNQAGIGDKTLRYVIPSCLVLRSSPAIRLLSGYRELDFTIGNAYIGHQAEQGDTYDFDGNQVQITWDGNSQKLINAHDIWSDLLEIAITENKAIVVSTFFSGAATVPMSATFAGLYSYYKSGDDAATTDATGYSLCAPAGYLTLIQTLKPD